MTIRTKHSLLIILYVVCACYTVAVNSYETSRSTQATYDNARDARLQNGHSFAVPLYRSLLEKNRDDLTAASRIAAASSSPERHDNACPLPNNPDDATTLEDIKQMRLILRKSGYDNRHVQTLFNIPHYRREDGTKNHRLSFASGPVYVKPVPAGSKIYPLDLNEVTNSHQNERQLNSLKCLVTLFLLGLCVPYESAARSLLGGEETIALFQRLGLLYPCELESHILVPYVHLFPMDIQIPKSEDVNNDLNELVFVTDCHPVILGQTNVGKKEDGAVMYIGPDSLSLVQHLPLSSNIKMNSTGESNEIDTYSILDFCAGSGVQAIAVLAAVKIAHPNAKATFVDINSRALKFCLFNAILNEFDPNNLRVIKGDLLKGDVDSDCIGGEYGYNLQKQLQDEKASYLKNDLLTVLTSNIFKKDNKDTCSLNSFSGYDLILSNPPFIPVPLLQEKDVGMRKIDQEENQVSFDNISKRYGLFSSGGSSGEEVLKSIICLSGRLLKRYNSQHGQGLLAIVSEFMDPPMNANDSSSVLIKKVEKWWNGVDINNESIVPKISGTTYPDIIEAKGTLYTNEYPVSSSLYAERRSNNQSEYKLWLDHLDRLKIRSVSPGLLFVSVGNDMIPQNKLIKISHVQVPKTEQGSVWTPSNYNSVRFVQSHWSSFNKSN